MIVMHPIETLFATPSVGPDGEQLCFKAADEPPGWWIMKQRVSYRAADNRVASMVRISCRAADRTALCDPRHNTSSTF